VASPIGYKLSGIEPKNDAAYRAPGASVAFWKQAAAVGLRVKRNSLARGLDRHGKPMHPISPLTRKAREDDVDPVRGSRPYSPRGRANPLAPPLQATGGNSRTYALLHPTIEGESVWYSWGRDPSTGKDWGSVLARHAGGFWQKFVYPRQGPGFVKPRDVIGLSPADLRTIRSAMLKWWAANRHRWGAEENRKSFALPGPAHFTGFTGGRIGEGGEAYQYLGTTSLATKGPLPPLPPPRRPAAPPTPRPPFSPLATSRKPDLERMPPLVAGVKATTPIPARIAAQLPPSVKVRTVGQLISTPFGRWWWLIVGMGLWLTMLIDDREEKEAEAAA
jgi:hypothetical protein